MLDKLTLLKEINESSFAIIDLTLYLDTHPTDKEALNLFMTCKDKRKMALQNYETEFEPLIIDNYSGEDHWTWSDGPLPWDPFGSD